MNLSSLASSDTFVVKNFFTPSVRPKSAISTPKREEQSTPLVTPLGVPARQAMDALLSQFMFPAFHSTYLRFIAIDLIFDYWGQKRPH